MMPLSRLTSFATLSPGRGMKWRFPSPWGEGGVRQHAGRGAFF